MATSFLAKNGRPIRPQLHTPTTFRRAQRRLFSTPQTPISTPPPATELSPPGVTPPGSPTSASISGTRIPPPIIDRVLPWETPGVKKTTLYRISAPKLVYPAGSIDESLNQRFLRKMDMYLFRNFQVRAVLVGQRKHPFLDYPRLKEYWTAVGEINWSFNPENTFAMLNKIQAAGHADFHQELTELLWFGGILSYGNIMRETYAIIYNWISAENLPDVDGLCEEDDGVTFRKIIQQSLRVVRVKHTQELISRQYDKLSKIKLILRPSGMSAYFAQMNKVRLELKKQR